MDFKNIRKIRIPLNTKSISSDKKFIIFSRFLDLRVPFNSKLGLPNSGMYFVEFLSKLNFEDKKILDVGSGYFGYLSKHIEFFGSNNITAVDIDKNAIKFARSNFFSKSIDYRVGDVYSSIGKKEKFDIIISNPPQLPSKIGGKLHDVAGKDGLAVIKKILSGFRSKAFKDGEIFLLSFDFLYKRVEKICVNHRLKCEIVAYYNKKIREGGETEKRLDYIENVYTDYKFLKKKKNFYHKVFILKISRYENYH